MTASEFAFLALGLVLGVASGAALVEVLRARPPARREVKVTVTPNSIHARRATTLSDPDYAPSAAEVARRGPADRRWVDRDMPPADEPVPASGGSSRGLPGRTPVPSGAPTEATSAGVAPDVDAAAPFRLAPTQPPLLARGPAGPAAPPPRPLTAIPVSREVDPMLAALRATAAASATAAMRSSARASERSGPPPVATAEPEPDDPDPASHDVAGHAQPTGPAAADDDAPAGETRAAAAPAGVAVDDGPCADERRIAEERCAVATRAREGAGAAADAIRDAQRAYDEHVSQAEAETAAGDPRTVRRAKEAAQAAFRQQRATARDREEIETAARTWLTEINRINLETREAGARLERHRQAAAELAPRLERLAVEADAARIAAEVAEEACVAAREAVAACDEARVLAEGAAAAARPADALVAAVAGAAGDDDDGLAMASRAPADAALLRILRGDRGALQRVVDRLGGDDPAERKRWQASLTDLVEALVARAIEASSLDFPVEHFFWGPFNRSQNRDIASALASLGHRYDGFGGWVDERAPSQRDLSLAVGYAGLDPMRIRHWPSESEMPDLLREVTVAADEYVAEAAGGLSLGEMLTLLGRRADPLTDLWNEWGIVRPVLLEAV